MKKKNVSAPVEQAEAVAVSQPYTKQDILWISLFSVALLLAMTVQTGRMSMILLFGALALSIGKTPVANFRERFSIPMIGLLLFAVMQGAAAIYSPFDDYASREYVKFLAAFGLSVILLARMAKHHIRGLLWGISAVCAFIALVCVDMASWSVIFEVFNAVVQVLGGTFADVVEASQGGRINGIYNDANITGVILGMAMLIDWYLIHTEKCARKKLLASVFLGISAVSFLMAMSRGAMLCFCLAALVYLIVEREDRIGLFFLMLSTLIGLAVGGGIGYMKLEVGSIVPVLATILCGLVIFALDWGVGSRLANLLRGHGKIMMAACGAMAVAVCVFGVVALRTMEPYALGNGMITRAVALEPGEYTVSGDWDDGETTMLLVYSRSEKEALLRKETVQYSGAIETAVITVPEDATSVFFRVSGEEGNEIRELTLSDGTEIPLAYKYLPEEIAGRLHDGLLQGHNVQQRFQYMRDALKIFAATPIIGSGLGSTEGLYTAIQPYYYESKYVHNHILQVMADMGLLGLIGFLGLLLGDAWLLLRRLRKEKDALAAMLLACWVMLNAHSLLEINFSVRGSLCLMMVLLTLPILLYAEPITIPLKGKLTKWSGIAVACCFWLYIAVFGGLYEMHRMVDREAASFSTNNAVTFLAKLRSFADRDVFTRENYQLTYVANAVALDAYQDNSTVAKYVKSLRNRGTYTANAELAEYYYLPLGQFEELFACSREGLAQEASTKECWNLQLDFYRTDVLEAAGGENMDVYVDGVTALQDYLEEFSVGRYEEIALTEENQLFLSDFAAAVDSGLSGQALYLHLTETCGYGLPETEE